MRKCGYVLALGVALLAAPASNGDVGLVGGTADRAPQPQPFDLKANCLGATDIVVTDADGRVLECWRGELKPGEVVRLGPASLTLANALPLHALRLRPERSVNWLYQQPEPAVWRDYYGPWRAGVSEFLAPNSAERELRMVLFLRKEGTTGFGRVWMPPAAPVTQAQWELGGGAAGIWCVASDPVPPVRPT
ncbi:MAG: hypothetical protein K2V38_18730, partial [Gemmataceae bacterium]|nr:hypothetical protein [Gemmataceae bacterium]